MKKSYITPRFNEAIVEQFNENEMAVISGGKVAPASQSDVTNYVCPTNAYCPKKQSSK